MAKTAGVLKYAVVKVNAQFMEDYEVSQISTYLDKIGLFCSVVALIYFDTNSRRCLGPKWRQSLGFRC